MLVNIQAPPGKNCVFKGEIMVLMMQQKTDFQMKNQASAIKGGGVALRGVVVGLLAGLSMAHPAFAQDDTSLPAIPDHYQEAGLSSTKGYENQAPNEAIDTFSGKLQYHFTAVLGSRQSWGQVLQCDTC